MNLLDQTVAQVLPLPSKQEHDMDQNFGVPRMRRAFGEWTLGTLHTTLATTKVLCCGKKHEEDGAGYEWCEHFQNNLVCGHLIHTMNVVNTPLRNAAGVIATSAHVVDQLSEKITDRYLPLLKQIGLQSHLIDGAAFAEFDRRKNGHILNRFINVPDEYKQPALQEILDINDLRREIMRQESELAPSIVKVRDEVLGYLGNALNLG